MNDNDQQKRNWPFRFLGWICPDHLLEEIEGDLLQRYKKDTKNFGERKAKRRFLWNTLRFFRPGIILRNKFSFELIQIHMIRSYLTILFRHTLKRKFYSTINVLCLTVGITFAMLIGIFIYNELQVNQDLKDVDRLFLMESRTKSNGDIFPFTPGILPRQTHEQYPNLVENYYRFLDRNITVSKGDKHFRLQSMIGDPSFIDIFGFTAVAGGGDNVLKSPNSIVITRKTALQFFDRIDVAGETLTVSTEQNGFQDYKVTAVIENPSDKNSVTDFMNMNAQVFLSLENSKDFFPQFEPNRWQEMITYIKLSSSDPGDVQRIMNDMVKKDGPKAFSDIKEVTLSPIADYYRATNQGAVWKLVLSLTAIVVFILLLAISNFINISVASSFSRFKEVGIRKVIGGLQKQVVTQFLLESMVLSFFSGLIGVGGYELFRGYFSELLGSDLPSSLAFDSSFWLVIFATVVVIGLLAGIYPAIFQSLAKPIDSLKGKSKSVKNNIQFSQSLITVQFLITLFIFISAVVLSQQASYFLERDLGYNKSHVLVVTSVPRFWSEAGFQKMESAKKEFSTSSDIQAVSLSWGAPGRNFSPGGGVVYKSGTPVEKGVSFVITCGDENYKDVFDLKLAAGNFWETSGSEQPNQVLINEAAQKALGVEVGDQLKGVAYGDTIFTVKGILKDFHYASLHERVDPMMLMRTKDFRAYRFFNFRLNPSNISESVATVEKLWKQVFPDDPCDFYFADQGLENLYTTELQMKKAASVATVLMLIIVLTGVLGLVSLSVSKRSKEIGIRKVLGASVSNILLLLSKEYVKLMIAAFVIAVPLAYMFSRKWLEGFVYHVSLSWWMFVIPIVSLLLIITLIVCVQALRTALSNPVKSLKYE